VSVRVNDMKKVRRNATPHYRPPGPRRATICIKLGNPAEVRAARAWLDQHRPRLLFVSDDEGCGCCASIWRVEGPAEILDTLPADIRTDSDWSR
jgi:hypothetical protein